MVPALVSAGAADPGHLALVPVAAGFTRPTGVFTAGDERLFVIEKAGVIRVVEDVATGRVRPEPFLDIRDHVRSRGVEQGLTGLAFPPDYAEHGRFLVSYTGPTGNSLVAMFRVRPDDPNRADPDTETVILGVPEPHEWHNVTTIAFGPDGMLYIAVGDGGPGLDPRNNAQDRTDLLGSILRIDVNLDGVPIGPYTIPPDNPFVGNPETRPEIWAYGLRNPWQFRFDPGSDLIAIPDVGQDRREEINILPVGDARGGNFGWNIREGSLCLGREPCRSEGLVFPAIEYERREGGCAVTGGAFYRGSTFPELVGNYLFSDYCSGRLWRAVAAADGGWEVASPVDTGLNISAFGVGADGELYVTSYSDGSIHRVVLMMEPAEVGVIPAASG
jgi:glucose/arabinose dehydrogenase